MAAIKRCLWPENNSINLCILIRASGNYKGLRSRFRWGQGLENYLGGQMLSKDSGYFGYCSPARQLWIWNHMGVTCASRTCGTHIICMQNSNLISFYCNAICSQWKAAAPPASAGLPINNPWTIPPKPPHKPPHFNPLLHLRLCAILMKSLVSWPFVFHHVFAGKADRQAKKRNCLPFFINKFLLGDGRTE